MSLFELASVIIHCDRFSNFIGLNEIFFGSLLKIFEIAMEIFDIAIKNFWNDFILNDDLEQSVREERKRGCSTLYCTIEA